MSLLLNKLLPLPFLPIGLCCLLIGFGLRKNRRHRAVLGVLLLWGFSMPLTADWLLSTLEERTARVSVEDCRPADAIVVLGGYLRQVPGSSGEHLEFGEAADRFFRAIELWEAGKAPQVVFSRGYAPEIYGDGVPEGELSAQAAPRYGLPSEAIVLTARVANTAEEAAAVADLVRKRGWIRVILVTSAFHLPRALQQFRDAGVECVPFPCDWRRRPTGGRSVIDLVPSAEALEDSERALREWYGRAFYALRSLWREPAPPAARPPPEPATPATIAALGA